MVTFFQDRRHTPMWTGQTSILVILQRQISLPFHQGWEMAAILPFGVMVHLINQSVLLQILVFLPTSNCF